MGDMIAASTSPPVAYLFEPFGVLHRPGVCAATFPYWFPYVCRENERRVIGALRDMLDLRYGWGAELRAIRSAKDAVRMARDGSRFVRWRRRRARPMLNDPFAVYSAGWLADTFGMQVVVLVRHPASFVSSIVGLGWRHPFGDFLAQPLLMRDVLAPYADDIQRFAVSEQPLFDQAILLWNVLTHPILGYREARPGWLFLRYEDVASDPQAGFRRIYEHLGLAFDERVRATIDDHSHGGSPVTAPDATSRRRDSRAAAEAWRLRLNPHEVERIREGVEQVAKEFYGDDDW
jgi:hypothetical protein